MLKRPYPTSVQTAPYTLIRSLPIAVLLLFWQTLDMEVSQL